MADWERGKFGTMHWNKMTTVAGYVNGPFGIYNGKPYGRWYAVHLNTGLSAGEFKLLLLAKAYANDLIPLSKAWNRVTGLKRGRLRGAVSKVRIKHGLWALRRVT